MHTDTIIIITAIVICGILIIAFTVIVRRLHELHLTMDSRLDELLKTTKILARAEGFTAGQQDQKDLDAVRDAGSRLTDPGRR